MYHRLPDPHPGRCNNFRFNPNIMQTERCLDYEDTEHICHFENAPPPPSGDVRISGSMSTPRKPDRWVRPGDAPRSTSEPRIS